MKRIIALSASLGFGLMFNSVVTAAVPTLEIVGASGNTSTTGPSTVAQTNTYLFNADNPTANTFSQNYFPKTNVTYSLENQQYTNGLVFGGTNSSTIFIPLSGQGSPISSDFTSSRLNPSMGTGIDADLNYGSRILLQASVLGSSNGSNTSSRNGGLGYYFGDVVVTFNRDVKNPVINLSGIGGVAVSSGGNTAFGITTNFVLTNPPSGTTIRRLSGRNLSVNGFNITNSASLYGATTGGNNNSNHNATGANGGASGSVQVENSNSIRTLRFKVYIASDYTGNSTLGWSSDSGDAFVFSAASVDSMVGDLVVSKTNNTTQVYSGSTTTYTVRVTNNGPDTYTGTLLKDVVGTGLTATAVACSMAAGNKCTTAPALNSLASVDTGSLASGEFYEILVTARVDAAAGSTVTNTATVDVPTLGSSTGASCTTLNSGGITRSFNSTTGACTTADQDTVLASADLEVSKTSDKTSYDVGDVVKYTIKAWNNGAAGVTDAVLADNVPNNIASLYWSCKSYGTAVCPSSVANGTETNSLSANGLTLPANGKDVNYLEFTVTGLAYKSGSVTNMASVTTATFENNLTNNSSSVDIIINSNSPITGGSSQNQCLSGQSANLVSDTAFRAYLVDNASTAYDNALKTAGANPTIVPNSVMYGTGANGALQLKGRVNWSNGSPKTSTSGATLKIMVDGVVYATLVTPAKSSNTRASFTAFNGAQVDTTDYAIGSYGTDPVAINFTITLPTTVTMAKIVRSEFQNVRPNTSTYVGDDIGIGFNELNVCLKPTFEMNKVSENGTDSFNFSSFANLSNANAETITSGEVVTTVIGAAQSVRLKKSTSPVEQGSLLAYATPNTAISFTESTSTLYSLKSIECTDTNAAVSGNSAANLGGVNGLTQTIPAANVKFAAKLVCRVTNSKKAGYVFSGRVFNDNSGTTSDISKAYNAIVDAGELGIAGSTVELQDCSTKAVLAATTSNANGDFKIQTLDDVFAGRSNVCLVQRNLTGFDSVSSAKASGVTATADTGNDFFTIPKAANVTSYEGFLFGDAELQLLLTQNGQKTIVAGDVVDYPHELSAKSVMNVLNLTESKEQQPANNQPWQSLVYVDSNCNAQLDQGESLLSSRVLKANEKICLIQRVNSPTTAQGGDRFIASFKVNGKATYSTATTKESNSVNDITTIGTADLNMSKLVRKTSACPAPSNDSTPFTVTNQAAKGDYLEYQITYTNNSNKNLVDIVLKDSVPLGTVYGTMSCSASGCQTQESSGQLKWTIPGVLAPKQKGQVGFCVRIPN
ncbi:DUF11 domain-containing protein [Acinetobacter tandoii]|uniref:DUF11 domain-containing protein n=2 Tax=Acinetobacter tandoii TaxID=202954 RepID=R9B4M5_9GAMM|nr:DUF11 domain-containing protein [Acinetobacter tandoii]EOR09382.1 hypothetical protein I593_01090 [Acinetobacter tandoii DSM 14970 = CIP 107469]